MFMFNITSRENQVRFERGITNQRVQPISMIAFIKLVRETFGCELKQAKDFCDLMVNEMNKLTPSTDHLRNQIRDEVAKLKSNDDMYDVLRFIRTVTDNPHMGTFDENGNYNPRPL